MVIWTFIWFVRYLLQLKVKINMLACMGLAVNLLCYILGKAAVNTTFYSKFKFKFSILQIFNCSWVADQLTTIGGITLARAIGWKFCSFHFVYLLKAHMNLNGIQSLYSLMGSKCVDNKFQVPTEIYFGIYCYLTKCGFPIYPSHMVV